MAFTDARVVTAFATRLNNDHAISPDGKTLAFCGKRNGNFDVYTIPAAGGEEMRLTTARFNSIS